VARRRGNKIRKAARRAAYGTARTVLPQGVRRRVRSAIGPSKAEERQKAAKAERIAAKQAQAEEKRSRERQREVDLARKAESADLKRAKQATQAKTDSPSGVGPQ
jgi:hypothetical protein